MDGFVNGLPISVELAQQKLDDYCDYKLSIDISTYKSMSQKCRLIDEKYGDFWIEPWKVLSKMAKHPDRHKFKPWTIERLQKTLNQLSNNHLTVLEINYPRNGYARVSDDEFGEFSYRIDHLINGQAHQRRRVSKKKITLESVKQKIFEIHGDEVILDVTTFKTASSPARFIDKKYGEFWKAPKIVYGSKHRLEGSAHPHRKFDKIAKIKQNTKSIVHWKTNETLYPMSSYEWIVIYRFNEQQIDFDFQIPFTSNVPTAVTGKNSIYFIDFYVKSGKWLNTYIEVKGRWTDSGKAKWQEFHEQHPNSELWDCDKLIELDIMKYRGHSLEVMKNA